MRTYEAYADPSTAAPHAAGPRPSRILVVDDEVNQMLTLGMILGKLPNVEVLTSNSGEGALQILQQRAIDVLDPRPIDLLVTDYKLQGMDGLTLTMHARKLCPQLAVIMITAYGGEVCAQSWCTSIQTILDKPARVEVIREAALEALGRRNHA